MVGVEKQAVAGGQSGWLRDNEDRSVEGRYSMVSEGETERNKRRERENKQGFLKSQGNLDRFARKRKEDVTLQTDSTEVLMRYCYEMVVVVDGSGEQEANRMSVSEGIGG